MSEGRAAVLIESWRLRAAFVGGGRRPSGVTGSNRLLDGFAGGDARAITGTAAAFREPIGRAERCPGGVFSQSSEVFSVLETSVALRGVSAFGRLAGSSGFEDRGVLGVVEGAAKRGVGGGLAFSTFVDSGVERVLLGVVD
jgi:hypothetical protein